MRIIAGSHQGRPILEPTTREIRPMREAVRAALFSILQDVVVDSRFLDLFAGTGSVGLEALSRGAHSCDFVDSASEAIAIIQKNLEALELESLAQVHQQDALRAIEHFHEKREQFDLIFIGPPYGRGLAIQAFEQLAECPILSEDGIAITEVFKKEKLADAYGDYALFEERQYGDNLLKFYRTRNKDIPKDRAITGK
ncbi:16S rRNA (guanine(966)-N(2))-methyltransferase RsmD [Candidatus Acetothermia bacterium]|nr:16S rRNA (guanine(966)-N(2))-methyltransferase RsmD [Candidatus Acetothermia bacterium]MBI3661118.1 16S rRNA (guanine(966)-N(2))-methyltransferase RsmD [Candidatus Acetothermia bacterium]